MMILTNKIIVDSLKFLSDKELITVYAFVIMPNHFSPPAFVAHESITNTVLKNENNASVILKFIAAKVSYVKNLG